MVSLYSVTRLYTISDIDEIIAWDPLFKSLNTKILQRPQLDAILDVQQVVPLPEAEDYQIRVQRKTVKEREARQLSRDFTRYNVTVSTQTFENLPKRRAILRVIKSLVDAGVAPAVLAKFVTWRDLFFRVEGTLGRDQIIHAIVERNGETNVKRWFVADE